MTSSPLFPGPAYRIQTERLVIRCYNPADAGLLKAAIDENIDHLLPWMPWVRGEPRELQHKIELLRAFRAEFDLGNNFTYGIFNPDETRLLGGTGLHPRVGPGAIEIGYWIHKDFTNRGLATETSAALTKIAFEVQCVQRVEIHCDPLNLGSASVPRKLGYLHEGTRRQIFPMDEDDLRDTMIWTLLRQEYPASPSARTSLKAYDAAGRLILSS